MDREHFQPLLTRRAFLQGLPVAAAALATTTSGKAAASTETFTFFQINDLHYADADCGRWFRAVVEQMKASAPKAQLCLLCGDLANEGKQEAVAGIKETFEALGIPLMPVPGNHDFDSAESRTGYDAVFPGKLNYTFTHGGWQFVGLDTTMGTKYEKTSISDTTLAWLDAEVPKLDPQVPTIVFTHFPLGEGVTYVPVNASAVVERILKLNLVAAFSGHWHGASERQAGKAALTTNRCCARVRGNVDGSPLKGWFVCETKTDGSLTRRFVEFRAPADIPVPGPPPKPKK